MTASTPTHLAAVEAMARARRKTRSAIKAGVLIRPVACSKCDAMPRRRDGLNGVQAHHTDYSKPLQVEWLCPKCHRAVTPMPASPGAPCFGEKNGMRRRPERRPRGERQGSSLLTEAAVADIHKRRITAREYGWLYGVSRWPVLDVWHGRSWRHASPYAPTAGGAA